MIPTRHKISSTALPNNPNRERYSQSIELIASMLVRPFTSSSTIATYAGILGSIVDFHAESKRLFGKAPIFRNREALWRHMAPHAIEPSTVVLEFGVAWGYTSAWWLSSFPDLGVTWRGFDRFEGLPQSWGQYEKGAFSTSGVVPTTRDQRVTWVVGDVEDTVTAEIRDELLNFRKRILFFDLDLFSPSQHVWETLSPALRPGDLLYFDEARMPDERLLLRNSVAESYRWRCLGLTLNSLCLELLGPASDLEQ